MKTGPVLAFFTFLTAIFPVRVHLLVPPKTPVVSGFEPAAVGSNRELVCSDASQPGAGTAIEYKWYKYSTDRSGVENWESKGPIGTGRKYDLVMKKWVIYPGSNEEPVSGKYRCRASNSAGTRDSEWGDLYVYEPCSLYTVSVSPAKPAIGSTFTLNCYIPNPSGFPVNWMKKADASSAATDVAVANRKGCHALYSPRYSWSSCSPPSISSPTRTFNLQVTNAQPTDSAYWICKDIALSCDSRPVKLIVQAPPGTPKITGFPSGPVTLTAGMQLNLKCVALPYGDTYDWYRDGTKVTTSLSYDFHVTKESAGVYKCIARNTAGSATSSNKILVVYYKPDSVVVSSGKTSSHVGEKDKFTCAVSGGYPTPTVKVYFKRPGGTPEEVTQGQDRVMAKEDNQAEFYCEAKVTGYPALDMASSRKTYNVTFPNTNMYFRSNPSAAVQVGQVKKFTCQTDESNPITYIKWYQRIGSTWRDITTGKTSSERSGAYGGKIRISEWSVAATKDMNGALVRCTSRYLMEGHENVTSADITMHVKFNPSKITMTLKPSTSIPEGSSFNIVCETDSANPAADIQFHRNRTSVGNWEQLTSGIISDKDRPGEYNGRIRKSTLTVTANRLDTNAVFKCEVKEGSFKLNQTVTVNVYFPPIARMLSNPKPVQEADSLTLTCMASGGNPTYYTYKWFYKNKEIPNETSNDYHITNIKYTQSGTYRCQAINYRPNGKADSSLNIDILYKAKWNPELPEVFTVSRKTDTPMKLVLHVIANPPPTSVTWISPIMTTIGGDFTVAKVNDTAYTLSKQSVRIEDYGKYSVNVTNDVGISMFIFELQRAGPPQTPCCLRLVNATAVSLTLAFTSIFPGGSPQTFTIEKRTSGGKVWDIAVKGIADPGIGDNVTEKISGLKSDTNYEFRVKATNDDGDSNYEEILEAKTEAAPNVNLTVDRKDNQVTVSWPKLLKEYTKIQIRFCPEEGGSCDFHDVADPTSLESRFSVKEGSTYQYSMIIFDGEDVVFVSAFVKAPTSGLPVAAIAGSVGFVFLFIVVVLATVFLVKKRRVPEDITRCPAEGGARTYQTPDPVFRGHIYMNFYNRAFESDADPQTQSEPTYVNWPGNIRDTDPQKTQNEPAYVNWPPRVQENHAGSAEPERNYKPPLCEPGAREKYLVDREKVYVGTEFESPSARGNQTGSAEPERNYKPPQCVEHGAREKYLEDREKVYVGTEFKSPSARENQTGSAEPERNYKPPLCEPGAREKYLADRDKLYVVTELGRSSNSSSDEEVDHPYEELKITPDVISDQIYTKLRPWQLSHADCYKNNHEEAERTEDG